MKFNFKQLLIQNIKKTLWFSCLWVGLLHKGCISPVDIQAGSFTPSLVVEGFITDDFGPHEIRISRVAKFAGVRQGGAIRIVNNAEVQIIDDQGNSTPVRQQDIIRKEVFNGSEFGGCLPTLAFLEVKTNYLTPDNFKAEVGKSYVLEIRVDGKTYRSAPQLVLTTPEIDSLSLGFVTLPSSNDLAPRTGVEVFAAWNDPVGQDFYSWKINGIYGINTSSQGGIGECCLFDPTDLGATYCWIREQDIEGNIVALDDRFFEGQTAREKVGFVEDDGVRFADGRVPDSKQYYVEVEQYRFSQEAFNFFRNIDILSSIDGEIFDPPPVSIRGNIANINDSNELVVGFFGAFSVKRKGIFITKDLILDRQPFSGSCGDCRTRAGAQVEVPEVFRE